MNQFFSLISRIIYSSIILSFLTVNGSAAESAHQVNILFYYLTDLENHYESDTALAADIEAQVNQANLIFANSKVQVAFTTAGIEPWAFQTHSEAANREWSELNAHEIYNQMSVGVETLWNNGTFHQYEADILFLVDIRENHDSHCGWATIGKEEDLTNKAVNRSYGVIRLGRGCGTSASVLAHEIGHLLGAAHSLDEQLTASSYLGYGVQCGGKSTLMHPGFPKHDFVSSPDRMIGGEACGYTDAADNQQLFVDRAPLLAKQVEASDAALFAHSDHASHDHNHDHHEHLLALTDGQEPTSVAPNAAMSVDAEAGGNSSTSDNSNGPNGSDSSGGSSNPIILLGLLLISPIKWLIRF